MAEFELGLLGLNVTRNFLNFVGSTDAVDTFRFNISSPANFNLSLTRMAQNANIRLYRDVNNNGIVDAADGQFIASSSQTGNRDDFINTRLTTPGPYIVQVGRVGASNTNYRLRLSNTGSSPSNLLPLEFNASVLGTVPFSRRDSLGLRDTADVYRFRMTTPGNFNATLTGIAAGTDLDMRLIRDANNNGIVDATDEVVRASLGSNNDDAISMRSLATGTYFLQTFLYAGTGSRYTLRMSNTGNAGSLPSNLLFTDVNVGTLDSNPFERFDTLVPNDASTLYRFTMSTSGNFNAALTSIPAGNDFDMRLIRDVNGNGIVDTGDELVRASVGSNNDDAINVRSLAAGNYVLQTYLYAGTGGGYNLKMSNTGNSGTDPSNLLPAEVNVGTITTSTTLNDAVSVNDAADTFRFSIANPRSVNLTLSGLSADADLRLIQDSNNNGIVDAGEELQRSSAGGSANDSITRNLAAGNYIAQVYLFPPTGSTSYDLIIA